MDHDPLPPDLAAALAELPRVSPPPPGEEDAMVRALRRRGLLPPPRLNRWAQAAGALAAGLALFAAGASYGSYRASSRALEAMLARQDRDAHTAALLVQRAGSAYVDALVRLAATSRADPADPALAGGREAGAAALRAAAAQLERMGAPAAINADQRGGSAARRQVIWF